MVRLPVPPPASIPTLALQDGLKKEDIDAAKVVDVWLANLQATFETKEWTKLADLLIQDSWWRDLDGLSFTIKTTHGLENIQKYAGASKSGLGELQAVKAAHPVLCPQVAEMGPMSFIQSAFTFQNQVGRGRGVVRLAHQGGSEWKAWTVMTKLEELNGEKHLLEDQLQNGAASNGASNGSSQASLPDSIQVLVVGAGGAGLALAAHLKNKGLNYLVIDKGTGAASMWRERYDSVRLHTPRIMDRYPFLDFPDDYPMFAHREQVIDFADKYKETLGLDVVYNTTASGAKWDAATKEYSVQVTQAGGESKIIRTKHLALATGLVSSTPRQPTFPGQDSFKGQMYHSVTHRSPADIPDLQNKKVLVVGTGTSAHDIAADFVTHGAKSVGLQQRSPIWSVSVDAMFKIQAALYNPELGLAIDDADLIGLSFPMQVLRAVAHGWGPVFGQIDKDLRAGLEKAGMALFPVDSGTTILDSQVIWGGSFYIEQGASAMIIDGRIKIYRDEGGIKEIVSDGVILSDGRKIDADVIILATGFEWNHVDVGKLMGSDVLETVRKQGEWGHMNESGERIGWWCKTGVPGFWYMTGSFAWNRQFSGILATAINAVETGAFSDYYD